MKKLVTLLASVLFTGAVFAADGAEQPAREMVPVLKKVAPVYPEMAHRKGLSGYVLVEYKLNENGRATDIEVVEAKPKRVFSKAAVRALKRSKFDVVSAEAEALPTQRKLYVFDVEQAKKARVASR